eukprot:1387116-Amphidinium_carterae.1
MGLLSTCLDTAKSARKSGQLLQLCERLSTSKAAVPPGRLPGLRGTRRGSPLHERLLFCWGGLSSIGVGYFQLKQPICMWPPSACTISVRVVLLGPYIGNVCCRAAPCERASWPKMRENNNGTVCVGWYSLYLGTCHPPSAISK